MAENAESCEKRRKREDEEEKGGVNSQERSK